MDDLNAQQKAAVTHTGSPLLIVAGAGTGKTTVITRKIAWLVDQKLAAPDEILALTFTEKAAGEMEERVDKLLPYGYVDTWILTFHSFAERILRRHGMDIGLPGDFRLLDDFGQWNLVRRNLDRFALEYYKPLGNPTKFIHTLLQHFSRAKDEDISPSAYREYVKGLQAAWDGEKVSASHNGIPAFAGMTQNNVRTAIQELAGLKGEPDDAVIEQELQRLEEVVRAYETYQQLLWDDGALDFGDLMTCLLKLFRERPRVLQQCREQFKYLLIDEFQDTNYAQYEIVKLLAGEGSSLTVVGDDDQSIFRFRGASMSNILQFKTDYPHSTEVVLTQNYRSAQDILDRAYEFIKLNNPNRLEYRLNVAQTVPGSPHASVPISKRLLSQLDAPGTVEVLTAADLHGEVAAVVNKILALKERDREATWNDFAILVRANSSAKDFINALDSAQIPYTFVSTQALYSQPVIMDILAYLRLIDNFNDSNAAYRVLNLPMFALTAEEVMEFLHRARQRSVPLFDAVRTAAAGSNGNSKKAARVVRLAEGHAAAIRSEKPTELIQRFMEESGYYAFIAKKDGVAAREISRQLNALIKRVQAFEAEVNEPTVHNLLNEIDSELEAGNEGALEADPEAGPEMVRVMTVHASKGLEFKYVFIVNMVDLRFPTIERKEPIALPGALMKETVPAGDTHLEEERRLLYVAMTRAKRGLYLSWAPDYGGARPKKPSRFLVEAGLLGTSGSSLPPASETEGELPSPGAVTHQQLPTIGTGEEKKPAPYALPAFYSFTQLQAFGTCPYQYRFAHILKIPRRGKAPFSFGQTIHLTLQKFFELYLQRSGRGQGSLFQQPPAEPVTAADNVVSQAELLAIYNGCWIDHWYDDAEQKAQYRAKGEQILKDFYAKHAGDWPKVDMLERGFRLKLGGYTLYGKIDRIDRLNGGVQLVDYKTGRPKTAGKLDSDGKQQLLLYQMAAAEALQLKVENLKFYYLDDNSEIDFIGKEKDMEKVREKVVSQIQEIEDAIKRDEFPPKPGPLCRFCDFRDICEYRQL